MMTEERIKKLEELGFKRWTKGSYDRLYINATLIGLELDYYKTGNISSARWNGMTISHAEGGRMKAAKTYIDVATGEVHSDYEELAEAARKLMEETEEIEVQEEEQEEQEEHEMKSRERWIDEAQKEIAGYSAVGEFITKGLVRGEIEDLYGSDDPEMRAAIDAEGGVEEYVDTLWSYIEVELAKKKLWYAVIDEDSEYSDGSYGSEDLETAKKMARELENPYAYIAVIDMTDDDDAPMCIGEIYLDDEE